MPPCRSPTVVRRCSSVPSRTSVWAISGDTPEMITAAPMTAAGDSRVPIRSDADVVTARQQGRAIASEVGFAGTDLVLIATAISELARNILVYAGVGEIALHALLNGG